MPEWTLDAGRTILRNGKEAFCIHKEAGMRPTEADALAKLIVDILNETDFDEVHEAHLRS